MWCVVCVVDPAILDPSLKHLVYVGEPAGVTQEGQPRVFVFLRLPSALLALYFIFFRDKGSAAHFSRRVSDGISFAHVKSLIATARWRCVTKTDKSSTWC